MGYQEYIIKVTDNNIQSTIEKLNELINNLSDVDSSDIELLSTKATLNQDVFLYEFGKTKDDWLVKLHKDDTFLLLCGERYYGRRVLNQITNPVFPIDTVMRCAETNEYDKVFTDTPIEELEYERD